MALPQDDPALRLLTEKNAADKYAPAVVVKQSTNNNDTAAVQEALEKCRVAGGGEVVIPYTGTDWRLGKLTIYRNTTFRCQPGVVIKRKGTTYGFTNYAPGINPLADNTDPYSGHGNIRIIGGTWDGNLLAEAYSSLGFSMFYFVSARGVWVEGVTVKDGVTAHAIDLNGCADVVIRDSRFIGYKDATVPGDLGYPRTYTEAIQYSQNLDESVTGATYALGSPSTNVTIDNCVFGPSGTAGTQAWPTAFGNHTSSNDTLSNDITITGNTFNGCTYAALTLYTYNDVRITGNRFNNCAYAVKGSNLSTGTAWNKTTSTWTSGLGTRMETRGLVIADNYMVDTTNTDISVLGTTGDGGGFWATMNDITINGNIMKATTTAKRSGSNIRLLLCRDAIVANNQCNNAAEGIFVDVCPNVAVLGNRVYNTGGYGIRVVKQSTPPGTDAKYAISNRVIGNHIDKAGGNALGVNGVYFATIEDNSIIDWGAAANINANGILISGSDQGLVSGNNIRTSTAGQGSAIYLTVATTNFSIAQNNKIEKDGSKIVLNAGAGNTYGALAYTVG